MTDKAKRYKEVLDTLTLLFAATAAIAAGFAAYYSNGQLREMQNQTANAARSWIGYQVDSQTGLPFTIDDVQVSPRLSVTAHYTIENFGNGPAIKVIPTYFVVTDNNKTTEDRTADFICEASKRFSTGTVPVGPGVSNPGPLGYVLFPKQTYSRQEPWGGDAQPSLKWLYVMGCAAYMDQFRAWHWTRACVLVGDGRNPVANSSPRKLCTLYNDTDETGDKGSPALRRGDSSGRENASRVAAMTDSTPSLIAWWGAVLSTLLALVKLWELWRDRFQVDISFNFTGSQEIGNQILIRNLSSRAFILGHWELLYCTGRWPARRFTPLASREYDAGDRSVEPYSTYTLSFSDEDYFDWSVDSLKGRRIFIRLHIAGRKPTIRLVYPP